jgi:hypothetical protein
MFIKIASKATMERPPQAAAIEQAASNFKAPATKLMALRR